MKDGTNFSMIPVDPGQPNAVPILRSKDQHDGLVFTWSTWLWLQSPTLPRHGCKDCPPESANQYHHIFYNLSNLFLLNYHFYIF